MLDKIQRLFTPEEILAGKFGLEREGLRVDKEGKLALSPHPQIFGSKLKNPYITTDFSESQIEIITPTFNTTKEVYNFVDALYDIVSLNIGDEYLWPQSMPCHLPEDSQIPIAEYEDCEPCKEARNYREELFKKYGGKKQLISGIHYNFSFDEDFLKKLYALSGEKQSFQLFKNEVYLKVVRNYLNYRWLLIYLIGAAPVIHESYLDDCSKQFMAINKESYTTEGAMSYRLSECGYKNDVDLYPDYTTVASYIESIKGFISSGKIQSYKELYSQIRPKAKDNTKLLESIEKDGIQYIEVRSIDINPFDKAGISLETLDFVHVFMIYLLLKEEDQSRTSEAIQKEGNYNQALIAKSGLNAITLMRSGKAVDKTQWETLSVTPEESPL